MFTIFDPSIVNSVKCGQMWQIWYQNEPVGIVFLIMHRFLLGKLIQYVNTRPEEEVESNGN